jgi:hypothetical protein
MTAPSRAPPSPTLNATKATPNRATKIAFRACADTCQIPLPGESMQCAFIRPPVGDYGNTLASKNSLGAERDCRRYFAFVRCGWARQSRSCIAADRHGPPLV